MRNVVARQPAIPHRLFGTRGPFAPESLSKVCRLKGQILGCRGAQLSMFGNRRSVLCDLANPHYDIQFFFQRNGPVGADFFF